MSATIPHNPLSKRKYIWRGWRNWFRRIAAFGTPHSDGERTLVPVQYTTGEYAILAVYELVIAQGYTATHARELYAHDDRCNELIRTAKGMPWIMAVFGDSIRIAVTDGPNEGYVLIRRDDNSIVEEQIVLV